MQFLDQITGIVRFADVNRIISGISLKRARRLVIQVAAVDDEDDFADAWQLAQVVGHFVGRQGLARTRRVPDIAGLTAAACVGIDGITDGFDGVNLVRPQHDEGFPFTVEDRVLRNHAMRRRDGKDCLGKGDVFRHRLVILIEPCRQELFIEVAFAGRSNIARIGGIGDDEHLERRVNIPESPFLEVLLNLIEGFPGRDDCGFSTQSESWEGH